MPKKSRRAKLLQTKRKERGQHPSAGISQPPKVTEIHKPVTSALPASTPVPKKTLKTARYPYVTAELRRIGILAGIMLVILIVLALALP